METTVRLEYHLAEITCELSRIFGPVAALVPDGPPGSSDFLFHAGVLPIPPNLLSSDRILFRKLHHDYNGWQRADALWMYLSPQKCRELGVFLLACAFHHPAKATTLAITHPDSAIRRIIIPAVSLKLEDLPIGQTWVPFALRYFPAETEKFPWMDDCCVHDLPLFALTNIDDCVGPTDADWRERDTVRIWATTGGSLRFAELLLNAGCSWNRVREYALEGDAGFRGVAPMSTELRIFLPGGDGWPYEGDDVPIAGVQF